MKGDETLDTKNNAIDSQIADFWEFQYPDEWKGLGTESGKGDNIRDNLRRAYSILIFNVKYMSRQGGKRKRRRKTKKRRKKNRKKRTKRRR